MTDRKIETMKGMCVVDITKYIMQLLSIDAEMAYAKLMTMKLFSLIMDTESGMYLEQNEFLFECAKIEILDGVDALYGYLVA